MLVRYVSANCLELVAEDRRDILRLALCSREPISSEVLNHVKHAVLTFIVEDLDNDSARRDFRAGATTGGDAQHTCFDAAGNPTSKR